MSTSSFQLSEYKSYMLNRYTISSTLTQYIEDCATNEVIGANHSFHHIQVCNWSDDIERLFTTLGEYFSSSVIPINSSNVGNIASFYTSNLNLILKIIKLDFKMPYARNMYNVTIVFNEKTSVDIFGRSITLDDAVNIVINRRFNSQSKELDLSCFSKDHEFLEWKVHFYKLSLLAHFTLLMLRIGRETRLLNLSKNRLSKIPLDILNFFIRGDLISIDLSYNRIESLTDLSRVSSKIEKLWIEGNPLCDDVEPNVYVKNVITKFPRLTELDGIKLNEYGLVPMRKNFLVTPDKCTKLVVERFLIMFFSLYDSKKLYKNSFMYDDNAVFSLMTSEADELRLGWKYKNHSRNVLDQRKNSLTNSHDKLYTKTRLMSVLSAMPVTVHDPHTFTVDVLQHDQQCLVLVVDGIYKEIATKNSPEQYFNFRRTFVLATYPKTDLGRSYTIFTIMNDMLYVGLASEEQIRKSFKYPIINFNTLALIDPNREEIDALVKVFMNYTRYKRSEAEMRLKLVNWDLEQALQQFYDLVKNDQIPENCFIDEEDDFSDTSSLLDYVD